MYLCNCLNASSIHPRFASSLTGERRREHTVKCRCAEDLFIDVIEILIIDVIEVWSDPKIEPAGQAELYKLLSHFGATF